MSKAHLTALVSALLFLRWLAAGHVALTVGGLTVTVPALAVAAVAVIAVTAAAVALIVYRTRAERAMLALAAASGLAHDRAMPDADGRMWRFVASAPEPKDTDL